MCLKARQKELKKFSEFETVEILSPSQKVCDSVFEVIGMLDLRSFVLKSFPIKSACVPSIFSRHRRS